MSQSRPSVVNLKKRVKQSPSKSQIEYNSSPSLSVEEEFTLPLHADASSKTQQIGSERRYLSTDPLELFLPLDDLVKIEYEQPLSFVPHEQKLELQSQHIQTSLFQKVNQWGRSMSRQLSAIDISLPDITLPDIQPPVIGFTRINRPAFAVFTILLTLSWLVLPSLATVNRGLRLKDNLELQVAAMGKLIDTEEDPEKLWTVLDSLDDISQGLTLTTQQLQGLEGNISFITQYIPLISLANRAERLTQYSAELVQLTAQLAATIESIRSGGMSIDSLEGESTSLSMVDVAKEFASAVQATKPVIQKIQDELQSIPVWLLPQEVKADMVLVREIIPPSLTILQKLEDALGAITIFGGYDIQQNYLLIFQNNQELRATGGFMGSYGLMKVDQGVIQSLEIEEIYRPDGQLQERIIPPGPLQELAPQWHLRDSNWYADFPTSAQNIISFYEKTGGLTPDGVIVLTPTVIERLLDIIGPVEMPEYEVVLDSSNFLQLTQYQTSEAYDRVENRPKQFIDDLAPRIIERVSSLQGDQLPEVMELIQGVMRERHLMAYFLRDEIQEQAQGLNITGELYTTDKDYLMVNHSNIGGYKTDGVMDNSVHVHTTITASGEMVNTVRVQRDHQGGDLDFEGWNQPNINYMRFYLPRGAELIDASGFESREPVKLDRRSVHYSRDALLASIESTLKEYDSLNLNSFIESDNTVVAGWVTTQPQSRSEVMIQYTLPFQLQRGDIYTFILQKQPGVIDMNWTHTIDYPESWGVGWHQSSLDLDWNTSHQVQYGDRVQNDQYIGLRFE